MATTTRLQLYDTLSSLHQQKSNIEKTNFSNSKST